METLRLLGWWWLGLGLVLTAVAAFLGLCWHVLSGEWPDGSPMHDAESIDRHRDQSHAIDRARSPR